MNKLPKQKKRKRKVVKHKKAKVTDTISRTFSSLVQIALRDLEMAEVKAQKRKAVIAMQALNDSKKKSSNYGLPSSKEVGGTGQKKKKKEVKKLSSTESPNMTCDLAASNSTCNFLTSVMLGQLEIPPKPGAPEVSRPWRDLKKERLTKVLAKKHKKKTPVKIPLRENMMEKLKAAQFRVVNEMLYQSESPSSSKEVLKTKEDFKKYHEGYKAQVKKWAVNPLDIIIQKINAMPKSLIIADMGCGEATLARNVVQSVRSFDLVACSPVVEACDTSNTPLLDSSVDVVVYCLALMANVLTPYLVEANRVLKKGGLLLLAEVESRFDSMEYFVKLVERLGFKLTKMDTQHRMFVFLDFKKVQDVPSDVRAPVISLKPCVYKKR